MANNDSIAGRRREILEFLLLSKGNIAIIVLSGFICALLAAFITLQMENVYQAEAKLVVTEPKFKSELSPSSLSVRSCENLLRSPWILEEARRRILDMRRNVLILLGNQPLSRDELNKRAIEIAAMPLEEWKDRFDLPTEEALWFQRLSPDDFIALYELDVEEFRKIAIENLRRQLDARISIERKTNILVEYSPIITVVGRMNSPRLARFFVNTVVKVFVDLYASVTSTETRESALLVQEKYEEAKEDLQATEDAITAFKEQYKLDLIDERIKAIEKTIQEQITQLKKMEAEYALKTGEITQILSHLNAMKEDDSWIGYFLSENEPTETSSSETPEVASAGEDKGAEAVRQSLRQIKDDYVATDKAWLEFAQTYRIDTTTQMLDSLRAMYNNYQEKLYDAELSVESLTRAVAELQKQLEKEAQTIALEKGITQDALWELIIQKPAEKDVANVAKISIQDQEINPTFIEMSKQLFQYESELERNRALVTRYKTLLDEINSKIKEAEELFAQGLNRQDQLMLNKRVVEDAYTKLSEFYVTLEEDEKTIALEIDQLRAKIDELSSTIIMHEEEVKELKDLYQEKKTELDRLERDYETYKESFKILATHREEARIAFISKPIDVRVATMAVTPNKKIGPMRSIIVLTVAALGTFAALIVVYLSQSIRYLKATQRKEETIA